MPQSSSAANINVDINQIATDLNLKADTDLINATPSSATVKSFLNDSGVRYVVEAYSTGSTWYRLYNDGWVEQGGKGTKTSSYGYETITLLKPMADTNYTLLNCNNASSSRGDQRDAYIISTTQIGLGWDGPQSPGAIWYVCGYAA